VEVVASLEIEVSRNKEYVSELKEANMIENRLNRITGVTSNKFKGSVKAKVISVLTAASLVMILVGNHSA
jgi:hypothetical protein